MEQQMSSSPARIQRRRIKGWRKPEGAVYVGRGTRWGNPWVVAQTRTGWAVNWVGEGQPRPDWTASTNSRHAAHVMAVGLYREFADLTVGFAVRARVELKGRDLMCWCPPELPCHVDVLLELASPPAT
jgi:hypothetical protein